MSERGSAFASKLKQASDDLVREVSALPAPLITWKPAPDVWSVLEILCHVDEFVPYWMDTAVQMATQPNRRWGRDHTHAGRLDAVGRAASRGVDEVIASIQAHVTRAAATMAGLSEADLATEAESVNPRWGVKPASFVIDDLIVRHIEKHIGQIRRNVGQYQEQA